MAWSPYSLRSQVTTPREDWQSATPTQRDIRNLVGNVNPRSALSQVFSNSSPACSSQAVAISQPTWTASEKLDFLPLSEWSEHNSYDEEDLIHVHYSIEWRVTFNSKTVFKDTELGLVLKPTAYWHVALKPKLEALLLRKFGQNKFTQCDDTNLVVSVNHRSRRDLTKTFEGLDIDWSIAERQLLAWSDLLQDGRRLRVELTFNFIDDKAAADMSAMRSTDKRGSSATKRMLAERAAQLDAQGGDGASSSIWQQVYSLMRCPGSPCALGPHCWRDPAGNKHYKLRTHHLKALIDFVTDGNTLQSHSDVPDHIREQLVAEEQQRIERQPKCVGTPVPSYPPINITNVLPSSQSPPQVDSIDSLSNVTTSTACIPSLSIPIPRDTAVRMYSEWQQTQVADEALQREFAKACNVALQDGLDLEQIVEEREVNFFVQKGVKRGIARRFVCDIGEWVNIYKNENSGH